MRFFLRAFGALYRLGLFMQAILHIMHIFSYFSLENQFFLMICVIFAYFFFTIS